MRVRAGHSPRLRANGQRLTGTAMRPRTATPPRTATNRRTGTATARGRAIACVFLRWWRAGPAGTSLAPYAAAAGPRRPTTRLGGDRRRGCPLGDPLLFGPQVRRLGPGGVLPHRRAGDRRAHGSCRRARTAGRAGAGARLRLRRRAADPGAVRALRELPGPRHLGD